MLNNKIIGSLAAECVLKVVEPFVLECAVNCVHNRGFGIENNIRIVCHSVWNVILTLKKINIVIVYTDIADIVCDFHVYTSLYINSQLLSRIFY